MCNFKPEQSQHKFRYAFRLHGVHRAFFQHPIKATLISGCPPWKLDGTVCHQPNALASFRKMLMAQEPIRQLRTGKKRESKSKPENCFEFVQLSVGQLDGLRLWGLTVGSPLPGGQRCLDQCHSVVTYESPVTSSSDEPSCSSVKSNPLPRSFIGSALPGAQCQALLDRTKDLARFPSPGNIYIGQFSVPLMILIAKSPVAPFTTFVYTIEKEGLVLQ
ncbi:hypothetical protein CB1_000898019, partial [Camelus ferus]